MSTKLPKLTRELLVAQERMDNPVGDDCKDVDCIACSCVPTDVFKFALAVRDSLGCMNREGLETALSLSMDGCDGGK